MLDGLALLLRLVYLVSECLRPLSFFLTAHKSTEGYQNVVDLFSPSNTRTITVFANVGSFLS